MSHVPVVIVVLAATVGAAEWWGPRLDVYCGGIGGLLLGAVGLVFSALIVKKHRGAEREKSGRWDIWTLWAVGFFVRVVLLSALCGAFWCAFDGRIASAALAMAGVFLALHFWDTFLLYRKFAPGNPGRIESNG